MGESVRYVCATPDCPERFRGTTAEPGLWCAICLEDLTPVSVVDLEQQEPR